MEYAAPVILFVVGFGAALLARKAGMWTGRRRGRSEFPMEKGVVHLDEVAKRDEDRGHR